MRGFVYQGKQMRDNSHPECHITNHKGTYLCTNIQPHPGTTAHNTGRIPTRVSCHFGCFVCVALLFLQKKCRNKKPKKSHPSTTSAHDLFSMQRLLCLSSRQNSFFSSFRPWPWPWPCAGLRAVKALRHIQRAMHGTELPSD